ncbi:MULTISPECIES: hypothetical protein [unclassified Enterococcus]|uniref:hypothetical protein n=1 Tax=unclassified Enterococcus TaxID=2608891 RepID=UPI00201B3F4C|nr:MULTISPECIES: hypothetical protein [unclassified Enterococcus]
MGQLKIIGAKTNNLKNIDIELSKNQLIVVTGPSGSGKSSFAFDTIYAEGRRRYLSSLSSYGKQLLGQMRNAEFESIKGLTPSIAVQQKSAVFSPRSTVGTMTEINDHLRLLWARLGDVYCPNHHQIIKKYDPESIVNEILAKYRKGEILVCANFFQEKDKSLSIEEKKQLIQKNGFSKIWLANDLYRLEEISSDLADSDWLVCIDRLIIDKTDKIENRLFEAVESAFINGDGLLQIIINRQISNTYINRAECLICHFKIDHIEPRLFSFNTPEGACQECSGLGSREAVDLSRVIPNKQLSLNEGVIFPNIDSSSDYYQSMLIQFAQSEGIDINKPFNQLSNAEQSKVLNGSNQKFLFKFNSYFSEINEKSIQFPGIIQQIENRYKKGMSIAARKKMGQYISDYQCEACKGQRLNDLALAVKIKDFAISEILDLQINDLIDFIQHLEFSKEKSIIFLPLKQLILDKLYFLEDIGLSYLSLSRNSNSLSGGEIQRIQLAAKISSKLTNIIYVLDEPSTGLHQRDKQ